jgi:cystathionine beta-lyase/cystathionine gamma-synthase
VVAGSRERIAAATASMRALGSSLDPMSCFLLDRGLKTLPLRMARHNANALTLARWLSEHPGVARVHHPSLDSRASLDRRADKGRLAEPYSGFGGMLSFELRTGDADRFLRSVELATHAASLGGTETLVVSPRRTSHAGLSPQQRAAAGVTDGLIRVSVGVEHVQDIIDDFGRAIVQAG